jgi:hypothetical protein
VCNVPCPPNPPWFVHHNNIRQVVQAVMLLIMQSSPASHYVLPLRSKHLPWHCSQTLSSSTLPIIWEKKFHTHTRQIINIFSYFSQVMGEKNLWTELYQASPEYTFWFFLHATFICYFHSDISEYCHIFTGCISYLYVVILSCI